MIARLILFVLLLLLGAIPASAHLTPNSEVRLDFGRSFVAAEIVIPTSEISYALGLSLPAETGPLPAPLDATLRAYLAPRFAVRAPDGRPWRVTLTGLSIVNDGAAPDLHVTADLHPPAGAPTRSFDLAYSAVIDRISNHFVMVVSRLDFAAGRLADEPQIIGGLQGNDRTIRVDRGPGSAMRGFGSAIRLGMHHIAEGHDHLLFLFALLLPAPLIAAGRRWAGYGGVRLTARRLTAVVTAFTIGHSLTLLGGAFLGWKLPAQPVEVLIAVSILVSAIHALRPLFAGREMFVAGGFGLVHGLAFATLIGHFGLEPLQKAQAILGFNLGIEIVQLGVVAAVLPGLLLLARTRAYQPFRIGAASFAAIAACAWIVERVLATENPVGRLIDTGLGHAPWLLAAFTLLAVVAWWSERGRRTGPPTAALG